MDKPRKKRRPLTEDEKRVMREKAAETRALNRAKKLEEKHELEKFKRYVSEKVRKFQFVEEFLRPYRRMFRGWTEEESYEKVKENIDEFRNSFLFEDFRNGIFKEDDLDKEILEIRKIKGEKIDENPCDHHFVQMIPSHKRVCEKCAEIYMGNVFVYGRIDLKGKSFPSYR